MSDTRNKTVAELVSENYKTAQVFKRNGIHHYSESKITLKEICLKQNIEYAQLKSELDAVKQPAGNLPDYQVWDLEKLVDHIVNTHHTYVTESTLVINQLAAKVAKEHGKTNPEVVQINYLFRIVSDELNRHMCKEENILFPYIKNLVLCELEKIEFKLPHFGTAKNPIQMMESDHDKVGEYGLKIAELSNNYTPPVHASDTYRKFYNLLWEFEEDLLLHIHLENDILFPRAIELERKYIKTLHD